MKLRYLLLLSMVVSVSGTSTKNIADDAFRFLLTRNNQTSHIESHSSWMLEEGANEPPPQVKHGALKKQLGANFDKKYMSVREPSTPHHGHRGHLLRRLLSGIKLADGLRLKLQRKAMNKFKKYLAELVSCPVMPKWKKLSRKFWPQWVNDGQCPAKTCSVPPGMTCKPSQTQMKTILYWLCNKTKGGCSWIPFSYPVLTQCKCSC